MRLAIPHGQRLPLAIAALGLLFLDLFLLYPLFNVFGASVLDPEGERLTLANYTRMLGRPFYRAAILNTLGIGLAATVITTVLAVPSRPASDGALLVNRGNRTFWPLVNHSRYSPSHHQWGAWP